MWYQPFRRLDDLLKGCDNHSDAYAAFLRSDNVSTSLADDCGDSPQKKEEGEGER